jgi:hypothetical protein
MNATRRRPASLKAEGLRAKTIVPLTDIPNVGRFYTFQNPQGAIVSVIGHWQGAAVLHPAT